MLKLNVSHMVTHGQTWSNMVTWSHMVTGSSWMFQERRLSFSSCSSVSSVDTIGQSWQSQGEFTQLLTKSKLGDFMIEFTKSKWVYNFVLQIWTELTYISVDFCQITLILNMSAVLVNLWIMKADPRLKKLSKLCQREKWDVIGRYAKVRES